MVMGDKTENNSKAILSESLKDYQGYFEIDFRKNTSSAFTAGAQNKLSPIAIYAEQIATRFGKVGRVDYLKIFAEMKNYVNNFSEKFNLKNLDTEFFTTRFLSIEESNKISDIELDLLSKLDEILISIQKESNHEFLQEVEASIPELRRKFDRTTALFEERAALIKEYSERHKIITASINDIDSRLKNMDNSSSISDIINTIEKKHEDLPAIYVALMELFSTHIPSYKNLTEQSDEFETAVEYYNEFIRIINNAKIAFSKNTLLSSDKDKVRDISKSSEDLSETLSALKNKRADADLAEESRRKRFKLVRTFLFIVGVLSVGAGAAYYFLK